MHTEFLSPDLISIARTSSTKPRSQAIVETASAIAESHHKTDPHNYLVKNGRLWSMTGKQFVEETTLPGSDMILLLKLQDWADKNSSGMAIWISPPIDAIHPSTKITTYELWSGQRTNLKMVRNNATLIDIDPTKLANMLTAYSINPLESNFTETELREKLIIILDKDKAEKLINSLTDQETSWAAYKTVIQSSRTIYQANRANPYEYALALEAEMGNFELGCNTVKVTTFKGVAEKISGTKAAGEDEYGSLEFNCPHCGTTNSRPPHTLVKYCKHCSGDVTC